MGTQGMVYVLGGGAIGLPLAAHLHNAGRRVVAVRTSHHGVAAQTARVSVDDGRTEIGAAVDTIPLAGLTRPDGTIVVTTKSYANDALARALRQTAACGPIVIMQNGIGVERPFLEAGFTRIFRCVLYVTSQASSEHSFRFRRIASSPIGIVGGHAAELDACIESLTTPGFPFHAQEGIEADVWKKAIVNAVFNSICPLLDTDNGIFARDADTAAMAAELVRECVTLTDRLGLRLDEDDLMERILRISRGSDGQFISTLQDLRAGRPTEIETLNLEMVRIAGTLQPSLRLPRVELLGRLIRARSDSGAGPDALG